MDSFHPEVESFSFHVPGNSGTVHVEVRRDNTANAVINVEPTNELMLEIESYNEGTALSETPNAFIQSLSRELVEATRRVLHLVKYGLNQAGLQENLLSVRYNDWSVDGDRWFRLTPNYSGYISNINSPLELNESTAAAVQQYIDTGYTPFAALRHLHRAKHESTPRYKWIDAAIAAELAIKEYLIRVKPELEALLLEVPSPPISKLYGSLLEAYSTGVSPKRNKLIQGAEVRNHMVHRPEAEEISIPEARAYVDHVESAIYDLIKRLMPDDPMVTKIHRSVTLQSDSHDRKPKNQK